MEIAVDGRVRGHLGPDRAARSCSRYRPGRRRRRCRSRPPRDRSATALARVLAAPRPDRVLSISSGLRVHDGGAGLLAGLGAGPTSRSTQGVEPLGRLTGST